MRAGHAGDDGVACRREGVRSAGRMERLNVEMIAEDETAELSRVSKAASVDKAPLGDLA